MRFQTATCTPLQCGTEGNVITEVEFAVWGVAAQQPDWNFTKEPGLCGLGVLSDFSSVRQAVRVDS